MDVILHNPPGRIHDTRTIVFGSDGTETVLMTLASLAAGQGRQSDLFDAGACREWVLTWALTAEWNSAPAVDETVELWLVRSNDAAGTIVDADLGIVDAGLTSTVVQKNLREYLGATIVQVTPTTTMLQGHGTWITTAQYFSLLLWNNSAADNFSATAANNYIELKMHTRS